MAGRDAVRGARAGRPHRAEELPAASLAPFDSETLRRSGIDWCVGWPEAPIAQPVSPLPDVPTLILSGDDDLRTPRRDAETVAERIPSAQLVTVPETGHSVLTSDLLGCADRALVRFFRDQRARSCTLDLPRAVGPAAVVPRTLAQVPAVRGLPGRSGRTLNAVGITLAGFSEDLVLQIVEVLMGGGDADDAIAFGGLRGGYARVDDDDFTLRRYGVVGGVHLSFRLTPDTIDEPLVLRVGGRDAARGWLRVGRRLTGRLGGRRIDVSLDSVLGDDDASASADRGLGVAERSFPTAARLLQQRAQALRLAGSLQPLARIAGPRPGAGRAAR